MRVVGHEKVPNREIGQFCDKVLVVLTVSESIVGRVKTVTEKLSSVRHCILDRYLMQRHCPYMDFYLREMDKLAVGGNNLQKCFASLLKEGLF